MSVCIFCGSQIGPTDGYFMSDGEHKHQVHDSCLHLMLAAAFAAGGQMDKATEALAFGMPVQP